VKAYHFTGEKLRNGAPVPPVGEWLEYEGEIEPCVSGLQASEHPFDALRHAQGSTLHSVEIEGDLVEHGTPVNKVVGRRRMILASVDASELLWCFARWCAMQVVDQWDAPPVMRQYLATGDESLRRAARIAAENAAKIAVRRSAVENVAWGVARPAAENAAWGAAWTAAAITWREPRTTPWRAALTAAGTAAWSASWREAWAAPLTTSAAFSAAKSAQRKRFAEMVDELFLPDPKNPQRNRREG
jgi:hypothetical protein